MRNTQHSLLRIESQVNSIVANCRLPAQADANLHCLIRSVAGRQPDAWPGSPARSRHDGAALVHGALGAYGKYFDDPDWSVETPARQ